MPTALRWVERAVPTGLRWEDAGGSGPPTAEANLDSSVQLGGSTEGAKIAHGHLSSTIQAGGTTVGQRLSEGVTTPLLRWVTRSDVTGLRWNAASGEVEPPAAPTGVSAARPHSVGLTWETPVSASLDIRWYRSPSGLSEWVIVVQDASDATQPIEDVGLDAGTGYDWYATAYNPAEDLESDPSPAVTATTTGQSSMPT